MAMRTNLSTLKVATLFRCSTLFFFFILPPLPLLPCSQFTSPFTFTSAARRMIRSEFLFGACMDPSCRLLRTFLLQTASMTFSWLSLRRITRAKMGGGDGRREGAKCEINRNTNNSSFALHQFQLNFHFIWRKISIYHQRVFFQLSLYRRFDISISISRSPPLLLCRCILYFLHTLNYIENMLKTLSQMLMI